MGKNEDRQTECTALSALHESIVLSSVVNGNICMVVLTEEKCCHSTLEFNWTRRESVLPTTGKFQSVKGDLKP
jgi:hypothetical protein